MAFASVPAFADEGDDSSTAELQDSDFVHITGGTSFYDVVTLPVNKINSFTAPDEERYYFYKLTLSNDGPINIPVISGAQEITLYNGAQEKMLELNSSLHSRKFGLSKGTYYLSFYFPSSRSRDDRNVQMRVNFTAQNDFEKESNDSFETANSVSLNKVYYGNGVNCSKDYFRFEVPENMNVRIAVKNTESIGVQVFRSDLSLVGQWGNQSSSGLAVVDDASFLLTKGTYYINIANAGNVFWDPYTEQDSDQEYSFKINATSVSNVTMHRLYNRWTGEHFYTSSSSEKDGLVKKGWSYEGVGWTAPSTSSKPVYRLYNKYVSGGDHHYTMDESEKNELVEKGWLMRGLDGIQTQIKASHFTVNITDMQKQGLITTQHRRMKTIIWLRRDGGPRG